MKQVVSEWHRITQLTEARDAFADTPCIYVQTDRDAKPVQVGKASTGHCQLVEGSALLPREIDAPDRSQQAHVTVSHSTNARVRSRRW